MAWLLPLILFPFALAILARNGWMRGVRQQHLTQPWLRWPLVAATLAVAVVAAVAHQWITLGLGLVFALSATFDPADTAR